MNSILKSIIMEKRITNSGGKLEEAILNFIRGSGGRESDFKLSEFYSYLIQEMSRKGVNLDNNVIGSIMAKDSFYQKVSSYIPEPVSDYRDIDLLKYLKPLADKIIEVFIRGN